MQRQRQTKRSHTTPIHSCHTHTLSLSSSLCTRSISNCLPPFSPSQTPSIYPRSIPSLLNLDVGLLHVCHPFGLHLGRQDGRDGGFTLDDGLDDLEDLVAMVSGVLALSVERSDHTARSVDLQVPERNMGDILLLAYVHVRRNHTQKPGDQSRWPTRR